VLPTDKTTYVNDTVSVIRPRCSIFGTNDVRSCSCVVHVFSDPAVACWIDHHGFKTSSFPKRTNGNLSPVLDYRARPPPLLRTAPRPSPWASTAAKRLCV
jgi:hypothetical protein